MNQDNIRTVLSYCKFRTKLFVVFGYTYLDVFQNSDRYNKRYALRCYENKETAYCNEYQEQIFNFWNRNRSRNEVTIRIKRPGENPFLYFSSMITSASAICESDFGLMFLDLFISLASMFKLKLRNKRASEYGYKELMIRFTERNDYLDVGRHIVFKDDKNGNFLYIDDRIVCCNRFMFKSLHLVAIDISKQITASELIDTARANYSKLLCLSE